VARLKNSNPTRQDWGVIRQESWRKGEHIARCSWGRGKRELGGVPGPRKKDWRIVMERKGSPRVGGLVGEAKKKGSLRGTWGKEITRSRGNCSRPRIYNTREGPTMGGKKEKGSLLLYRILRGQSVGQRSELQGNQATSCGEGTGSKKIAETLL